MSVLNLESNSPEGNTGSPNSDVSQGQGVSSTSNQDAAKLPEQVEAYVSKAIEKALQSTKDKRISGIEKTLADFTPVLEQVKTLLTPEQLKQFNQIQKDAEFEELKKAVYGNTQTSAPATGTQQGAATFDAQSVLKNYELDGNDPEVIAQVLSKASQLEMENAALKLAYRRAKPTTPSPAASSAVTGNPAVPEDQDAKIEKLAQLQKEPTKNRAAIKKLTEELGW